MSDRKRLLALIAGIILVVLSAIMVIFSIFLVTIGSGSSDSEGYRWSSSTDMITDSHAGVVAGLEVTPEEYVPPFLRWMIDPEDLTIIRIRVVGPPSEKELFVGMVEHNDAMTYFDRVRFHIAKNWDWNVSPWKVSLNIGEMILFNGTVEPQAPKEANVWVASGWGEERAVLEWIPQNGTYWVAIMNADGSTGIEGTVDFGARFPVLGKMFARFMVIGVLLAIVGAVIIYFGYMKPT